VLSLLLFEKNVKLQWLVVRVTINLS